MVWPYLLLVRHPGSQPGKVSSILTRATLGGSDETITLLHN